MDAYSRHEVLDRLSVALASYEDHVVGHAVVEAADDADPVKAAVLEAYETLARAYQAAGEAYLG